MAQEFWLFRIGQVDGEEGIGLAEGDQVACFSQEAGGFYLFSLCQALQLSFYGEVAAQDVEGVGFFGLSVVVAEKLFGAVVGYCLCLVFLDGCGDAQIGLVLIQGEAVVYSSGDFSLGLGVEAAF